MIYYSRLNDKCVLTDNFSIDDLSKQLINTIKNIIDQSNKKIILSNYFKFVQDMKNIFPQIN